LGKSEHCRGKHYNNDEGVSQHRQYVSGSTFRVNTA
jgi:hypothetical protein